MIYELRNYRLRVGAVPQYLKIFQEIGLPIAKRYMDLVGFWFTDIGESGHVQHMWRWEGLDARAAKRAALSADPVWIKEYLPVARPLIEETHVTILNPASFSPLK